VPNILERKTLDKRQIQSQIKVKLTVERFVFSCFWLAWCCWCYTLCQLGFGEDTDAWLMAQTAQKLSFGLPYDPARSFGNPLFEYLLVILQPNQQWFWSNLFNLLLASIFLWRISHYFSFLTNIQVLIIRLSLMAFPIFTEAASSSMEYMLAWLLFMETVAVHKTNSKWRALIFATLTVFTRLEFFPIFLFGLFPQLKGKISNAFTFYIGLTLAFVMYLVWAYGKNPSPFYSIESAIHFYAGRLYFLLRQAGIWIPVYLFLFSGIICRTFEFRRIGLASLLFFLLFPFEWAYAFPALLFGLFGWISTSSIQKRFVFLAGIFMVTCMDFSGKLNFGLASNFETRTEMNQLFKLATYANFEKPTLILYGATYFPTDTRLWIKQMENRLFNRKNSNLFVGEKLLDGEIDSLQNVGFQVFGYSAQNPKAEEKNRKVIWLDRRQLIDLLNGKSDNH